MAAWLSMPDDGIVNVTLSLIPLRYQSIEKGALSKNSRMRLASVERAFHHLYSKWKTLRSGG